MRFIVLNRKIHYWASAFIVLPLIIVLGSGLLLQLKKHWSWVQPDECVGSGTSPQINFEDILSSVKNLRNLEVDGWDDVTRMDVRPGKGIVKVRLRNGWEVQVDLGTGRVLQTAYRRSDLIESIHDGSFFAGKISKLGVFLPHGVLLLIMWLTGLIMFLRPLIIKRRKKNISSK